MGVTSLSVRICDFSNRTDMGAILTRGKRMPWPKPSQ
jgi:hypothetical protein